MGIYHGLHRQLSPGTAFALCIWVFIAGRIAHDGDRPFPVVPAGATPHQAGRAFCIVRHHFFLHADLFQLYHAARIYPSARHPERSRNLPADRQLHHGQSDVTELDTGDVGLCLIGYRDLAAAALL